MYCSACGSAVSRDLRYCNRCGAKVGAAKGDDAAESAESYAESLGWAAVVAFISGLGVIIGLMAVMKNVVGFDPGVILAITALSFALLLTIEGVLIRLLLKGGRGARGAGDAGRPGEQTTKELDEARPRTLPEPPPSVTEQTTRAFEPIRRERKST